MKKLIILVPALIFLASCKKNYSCTCNTISTVQNGGYTNQTQYKYKEFNEQAARDKCEKDYENNVKPTTDYKCEII